MVWNERVETTERFPPGECIEACSGIFGGQRSVVSMVWDERVETTGRGFIVVMSLADGYPQTNTSELARSALPVGILHTVCQHTDTGGGCDIVAVREAPDWYLDDGIQYLEAFR